MNPNLSPMSNSGVSLKIGQEVFFFEGKKKYLLLAVSPELKDQTLIVNELIKVRLKEIHAESESEKIPGLRQKRQNRKIEQLVYRTLSPFTTSGLPIFPAL